MPRGKNLFDTGPVVSAGDGWYVLNPQSTFPIAVFGIDLAAAEKLKRGLEKAYALHRDAEEAESRYEQEAAVTVVQCRDCGFAFGDLCQFSFDAVDADAA